MDIGFKVRCKGYTFFIRGEINVERVLKDYESTRILPYTLASNAILKREPRLKWVLVDLQDKKPVDLNTFCFENSLEPDDISQKYVHMFCILVPALARSPLDLISCMWKVVKNILHDSKDNSVQ